MSVYQAAVCENIQQDVPVVLADPPLADGTRVPGEHCHSSIAFHDHQLGTQEMSLRIIVDHWSTTSSGYPGFQTGICPLPYLAIVPATEA